MGSYNILRLLQFYNFTIAVQDETRYGNNVAFMDSQTKEEREAKMPKTYLGNGKVIWTSDGKIEVAEREDEKLAVAVDSQSGDLPF